MDMINTASNKDSETGLSYGLGVEGDIQTSSTFSLGLTLEYVSYVTDGEDVYDYSGVNIGVFKRF